MSDLRYTENSITGECLNSLCSVNRSQVSTRIIYPYHTATACGRVTSRKVFIDRTLL